MDTTGMIVERSKAYNDGWNGKQAPSGSEKSPGSAGVIYRLWKKGKDDKAAGKPYDQQYLMAVPVDLPLAAKPVPLPVAPPAGRRHRKTKKTKGKRKGKKATRRR